MPYTKDEARNPYHHALGLIEAMGIKTEGDLEFLICSLQDIFAAEREFRYKYLKRTVGCTMHAAHEFERRFLDPREDSARAENGEVFTRMVRRFEI